MDPEMVRQQRHEETLTLEAQDNSGVASIDLETANVPLISRLFAQRRPGTSLVPLSRREIAAPAAHGPRHIVGRKERWWRKALPTRTSPHPAESSRRLAGPEALLALPPAQGASALRHLTSSGKPVSLRWPLVALTTGLLALALAMSRLF